MERTARCTEERAGFLQKGRPEHGREDQKESATWKEVGTVPGVSQAEGPWGRHRPEASVHLRSAVPSSSRGGVSGLVLVGVGFIQGQLGATAGPDLLWGPILWDSSSPSVVPGPAASASPGNCRDEHSQPTWTSERKLPGESPQSRAPLPPPRGSWCSPGENLQFDWGPRRGWHWLGSRPGPGSGREAGGNRTG